jgi:hypothetical protein
MSKEINLNNKYRVLLTEVLPYELPLMLDNEGFYLNMQDESLQKIFKETFVGKLKDWTIPYDYSVRKYGGDKSRKLSLMHPYTQLQCVDFYAKHDNYMLSLCSNSPFSIRYIEKRAKCIFKKEDDENEVAQSYLKRVEIFDDEIEKYYRSYFMYKQYDMMYKFFISGDYLRLEQKHSHLMKMDIANCFYHIYTHTIAWAIKGKKLAKDFIGKTTFENEFDSLMQHTNYNETNGIIVGPEISRIFAEIILQRIDVNVLNRLKQKPLSLKLGRDYEVRRYLDDHYVYANSEENLRKILEVYKEELQFYKLFVNESKLEFLERPFVSDISDAKREISTLMSCIADKWLEKDDEGRYLHMVNNEMKAFSSVVNAFRSLVHRYKQKYGTLNRYLLTLLISQIGKEMNREKIPDASTGLLLMYTEIAFYVFSLDMNASASIKLCRILEYLHRWAENCTDKTVLSEMENRFYREMKRCLDIYETRHMENDVNIEVLNLLLCLSRLMKTPLSRTHLVKIFSISDGNKEDYVRLNYFQICTLMYIIGGNVNYEDVRKKIIEEVNRRLLVDCALWHSDNAMLFFDITVCPYVKKQEIKQIILKVYGCSGDAYGKKYKELTKTKRWFFNWDKTQKLSEILSKREYHSPYE